MTPCNPFYPSFYQKSASLSLLVFAGISLSAQESVPALENYVRQPDPAFNWKFTERINDKGHTLYRLELVSQHWRGQFWSHHLTVALPREVVFQTPNAGHDLGGGKDAVQTLAAFYRAIAGGKPLPEVTWRIEPGSNPVRLEVRVNRPAKAIRLWTADSQDRDFRDERWASRDLPAATGSNRATANIETPASGYRAYLAEVTLTADDGQEYRLSTEARVTPETLPVHPSGGQSP